jgi:protein TonB
MSGKRKSLRSRLPLIAGLSFMALFTFGVIWLVKGFIDNSEAPEKPRVQRISLVKPPPPKPEEKLPEPEKMEQEQPKLEEVQLDTPPTPDQPQDDGPPPGEQLGLDSDGSAGSDGFGLAARRGGRDITTLGGGGDRMAWYSKRLSRQLEDELKRAKALQGKDYQVVAQLWFDVGGSVTRVRMDKGSGSTELDEALRHELLSVTLREPLPEDMPQPVKLRVVSR